MNFRDSWMLFSGVLLLAVANLFLVDRPGVAFFASVAGAASLAAAFLDPEKE